MSTEEPLGMRIICPMCRGDGMRPVYRGVLGRDGEVDTRIVPERCRLCDGDGWLPLNPVTPGTSDQ